MDSVDIGHVPPPNPENFWDFTIGQQRTLIDGNANIKLLAIQSDVHGGMKFERVKVSMLLQAIDHPLIDWLNMDGNYIHDSLS